MLNNPVLTHQLVILGKLLGLKDNPVTGKFMYVYVALPTAVGVWSMALGLWRRIYYYGLLLGGC